MKTDASYAISISQNPSEEESFLSSIPSLNPFTANMMLNSRMSLHSLMQLDLQDLCFEFQDIHKRFLEHFHFCIHDKIMSAMLLPQNLEGNNALEIESSQNSDESEFQLNICTQMFAGTSYDELKSPFPSSADEVKNVFPSVELKHRQSQQISLAASPIGSFSELSNGTGTDCLNFSFPDLEQYNDKSSIPDKHHKTKQNLFQLNDYESSSSVPPSFKKKKIKLDYEYNPCAKPQFFCDKSLNISESVKSCPVRSIDNNFNLFSGPLNSCSNKTNLLRDDRPKSSLRLNLSQFQFSSQKRRTPPGALRQTVNNNSRDSSYLLTQTFRVHKGQTSKTVHKSYPSSPASCISSGSFYRENSFKNYIGKTSPHFHADSYSMELQVPPRNYFMSQGTSTVVPKPGKSLKFERIPGESSQTRLVFK